MSSQGILLHGSGREHLISMAPVEGLSARAANITFSSLSCQFCHAKLTEIGCNCCRSGNEAETVECARAGDQLNSSVDYMRRWQWSSRQDPHCVCAIWICDKACLLDPTLRYHRYRQMKRWRGRHRGGSTIFFLPSATMNGRCNPISKLLQGDRWAKPAMK